MSNDLIKETNQSYWQIGLMLGSGLGIVSMMIGGTVSHSYGAGSAITSILIGNFILWFIGLGIISMADFRSHIIQNVKMSLGRVSATGAALIIVAAFLVWYALQIQVPTQVLSMLVNPESPLSGNFELRISAALGLLCALISMGGIKIIRWVNILSFPIMFIFLAYILINFGSVPSFKNSWSISLSGILLVVLTWFPGTVNLSTFFRHSRSRADSILGLTIMTIVHALFQSCFIVLNVSDPIVFVQNIKNSGNNIGFIFAAFFVVISFLCVNLLNVYWASVGWEVFFKHKQEAKSYAIIGLSGTVIYIFFQYPIFISFIEYIGTSFIAILGVTLIASYIVKIIVQHRIRKADKLSNSICWFLGCGSSIICLANHPNDITFSVLTGINICLLSFGVIIFLEELFWSIGQQKNQK